MMRALPANPPLGDADDRRGEAPDVVVDYVKANADNDGLGGKVPGVLEYCSHYRLNPAQIRYPSAVASSRQTYPSPPQVSHWVTCRPFTTTSGG